MNEIDRMRLQDAIDAGVYSHRPGKRMAAQAHIDRRPATTPQDRSDKPEDFPEGVTPDGRLSHRTHDSVREHMFGSKPESEIRCPNCDSLQLTHEGTLDCDECGYYEDTL